MFQSTSIGRVLQCRALGAAVVLGAVAAVAPGGATRADEPSPLAVSSDFPSGSGEVESIDQEARIIRLKPTAHAGRGWTCWWYFHLTGIAAGETISIDLAGSKWAQPDRAAFSVDGKHWQHTPPGEKHNGHIVYQQKINASEAWFAWGPPFTEEDAVELVASADRTSPYAQAWTLCQSSEGRAVPALRVRQPGTEDSRRYGVWIGARQHAWESGSSWVARGLVEWLVSDDPRAEALRRKATVIVVPVMDMDNVAVGAGGKDQDPHDHNRDWSDEPHFPAVTAAQREIQRLQETGRFDLYLDLHNPSPENRHPFFYVPTPAVRADASSGNLERFLLAARAEMSGPLAFQGRTVESSRGNDPLWMRKSTVWVTKNSADHVVSTTLEVPWNTPHSTPEGYRNVGRMLGLAVERYLRQPPE